MTQTTSHRVTRAPSLIARLAAWFRRATRRRPDPWERRLEDMPEWLLQDIGLTRSGMKVGPFGMPLKNGK
jgi:uncharacterized protein YjiS (DUF1127 family)